MEEQVAQALADQASPRSSYKNFGASDEGARSWPAPDPDAGDPHPLVSGSGTDNDTAFFARVQVGDYKKPGQVAVRLVALRFRSPTRSSSPTPSPTPGVRPTSTATAIDVRSRHADEGLHQRHLVPTDWTIGDDRTMDRCQFDYIFKF